MLREAAKDEAAMLRYFPRKVKDQIGAKVGFRVAPSTPGMARARGIREGSQITGPQGTSARIGEGSFAEIQDVTAKILGESLYC